MSRVNLMLSLLAAAGIGFVAGYFVGESGTSGNRELSQDTLDKLVEAKGLKHCPSAGPKHAKVTIVEFSDFQ